MSEGVDLDNIQISVEEMVMRASLQRFHMVGQASQYFTLYRTVELYIEQLINNPSYG